MQAWINKPLGCLIGGYHFSSHLSLFGGTTTINQPGFINPGLTLQPNVMKARGALLDINLHTITMMNNIK